MKVVEYFYHFVLKFEEIRMFWELSSIILLLFFLSQMFEKIKQLGVPKNAKKKKLKSANTPNFYITFSFSQFFVRLKNTQSFILLVTDFSHSQLQHQYQIICILACSISAHLSLGSFSD